MLLKRINNILVIFIILCSTSFYNLKVLGPGQKVVEILGISIVLALFIIHVVYAKKIDLILHFSVFFILILISFFTSAYMAKYSRNQTFFETVFAQRALFYYMFYFLIHQMKIRVSDLEKIFILFGFLYFVLYLIQFTVFPKILFDVFMMKDRGTVRIYLPGSDYICTSVFIFAQKFFRTNNLKYFFLMILMYSIFILLGGRQTMILMAFCLVLFLLFSNRVKSRFALIIVVAIAVTLVFFVFKDIIDHMILVSKTQSSEGKEYIRVKAATFFLTDFFLSPWAYITGNGAPNLSTTYGKEIITYAKHGFYLGDIGTIGHYVLYGAFFIIGVLGICIKVLFSKFENKYSYLKYVFIGISFSLLMGPGFGNSDFIVYLCCALYIVDVSLNDIRKERLKEKLEVQESNNI
jgi:hypothetical protein